jgi:hypothetical protein
MRLESSDGVSALELTVAGYESPDDLSDWQTANWLEVDLRVRTPHGQGTSRVACMHTWDVSELADWLDAHGARRLWIRAAPFFLAPEPNLQLWFSGLLAALWSHRIALHVYFILEQPGEWQMDDASDAESTHYIGEMGLKVARAALREAAAALRAELRLFPVREAST